MAKLSPERWRRIDEVFQQAADLPASERPGFLDQETAGDPELRTTVEDMLEGLGGRLVEQAVAGGLALLGAGARSGEMIGPYRVLEPIGQGGMGSVYLAVRQGEDFEQRVAVKVLRGEVAGPALAARFSAERRILSALEHPYIARLVDGGTHEGLPFLVMEYVSGQPVDVYCRERGLDVRARLDLFRKICEAVTHAHHRLVVHSDLKPSNILVLEDGTPKLLDFGIARVIEEAEGAAPLTETGWRPMTLDYASPEQIRGERIGVASDIYSLGVVLHELLTGVRPHQVKRGRGGVVEPGGDLPAPSSRVKNHSRLRRELAGDLDNMLLMALRKEPERRYQSVEWFAEDVRRHLLGQTVMARPDTLGYRTQKFVKRNRTAVALGTALALTAAAGAFLTVREGQRAQQRFTQVRALANQVLTEFDAEARKLGGSEKLRQVMVGESLKYLDSLAAEASGDAKLRQEVALAYHRIADIQGYHRMPNLGRRDLALKYHEMALAMEERLRKEGHRNAELLRSLASGYARVAELKSRTGEPEGAKQALAKALELAEPGDPATYVPVHMQVSREHYYVGRFDDALRHKDLALASAKAMKDPAFRMVLLLERAQLLNLYGRSSEAAESAREGLRIAEETRKEFGADSAFRRRESMLRFELGSSFSQERACEAETQFEQSWALDVPEESQNAPMLAGIGLQWMAARAACGKPLPAEVLGKLRPLAAMNRAGLAKLEAAIAESEWRRGQKDAARQRLAAWLAQHGASEDVLELQARFHHGAGAREQAWWALREARRLRAPSLEQASPLVHRRRFDQAANLVRAIEWGDPQPGLRAELRTLVSRWPQHALGQELERIRAMAKKSSAD